MTDQCKHCTYRGDIEACLAAECNHHENWYAKQQQARIDVLEQKLEDAENLLIERGDNQ